MIAYACCARVHSPEISPPMMAIHSVIASRASWKLNCSEAERSSPHPTPRFTSAGVSAQVPLIASGALAGSTTNKLETQITCPDLCSINAIKFGNVLVL